MLGLRGRDGAVGQAGMREVLGAGQRYEKGDLIFWSKTINILAQQLGNVEFIGGNSQKSELTSSNVPLISCEVELAGLLIGHSICVAICSLKNR